jgi:Rod binding domain-containing protein
MTPISSLQTAAALPQDNAATRTLAQSLDHGPKSGLKSAGTFYQEMMKSVRKMHGKPAYMHGGQAEDMFQNQLDQHVSQDLAHTNGNQFADSLYQAFMANGRA